MIKHNWTILCKRGLVDQQNNNLSLIDLIEEIVLRLPQNQKLPLRININLTLASLWTLTKMPKKNREFYIKLELYNPNNKLIGKISDLPVKINPGKSRIRQFIQINDLLIEKSGLYNISLYFKIKKADKYKLVSKTSFEVKIIKNKINQKS